MGKVIVTDHPLIQHKLTLMRDLYAREEGCQKNASYFNQYNYIINI